MRQIAAVLFFSGLLLLSFTRNSEAAANLHSSSNIDVRMSVGFFYSSLSPYGEWIEIDAGYYGWRPRGVARGWRPYLHGRWAWTDYGWYWVSYEPFGWAVFHYGRWFYDDFYGWIWIPDHTWGPAWVEWRYNDDYIGWAPLPPYASFSITVGIRYTTRWWAPVHYWTFVPYRYFGSTTIVRYAVPAEYTRRLIGVTRSTARYEVDRNRVINRGVDRSFIERRGNTRIERVDVARTRERGERIVREGNRERIEAYEPEGRDFQDRSERIEARRPERRLSLDLERIERGGEVRERTRSEEGREERRQEVDRQWRPERQPEEFRRREVEPRREERSREQYSPPSERQVPPPGDRERLERREPSRERPAGREQVAPPRIERERPRSAPDQRGSTPERGRSPGRERRDQ